MEEQNKPELEMLTKIHNQLVDLKKIIVEIELAKPGTSHTLQTQLRQIIGQDQRVDSAGRSDVVQPREHKFIAPTDTSIKPGEAAPPPTGAGQ